MSANRDRWGPVGPGPARWSEEELLEWLLDPRARSRVPRSRIEAHPEAAASLAELEGLLETCRRAGARQGELAPARRRALALRALASTTRARPEASERGHHRRTRRLVAPRWVRAAAAVLLVAAALVWSVANRSQRSASPAISGEGPATPALELDAERAAVDPLGRELDMREWDPERFVAMSLSWARFRGGESAPLLERTLWCELLLDRHAALAGSAPELDEALVALAKEPLPNDDAGLLAAAALARAESLGVLPASAAGVLSRARRDLARTARAQVLIEPAEEVRRVASLDGAWRAALVAAAPDPLPSDLVRAIEGWQPR